MWWTLDGGAGHLVDMAGSENICFFKKCNLPQKKKIILEKTRVRCFNFILIETVKF